MRRYFVWSTALHAAVFAAFLFNLNSQPRKSYYGIDFISGAKSGFGPGQAGGSPAPAETSAPAVQAPPAPTEPERVEKKTEFVAKDNRKIQVPKKDIKSKTVPTRVNAAKKKVLDDAIVPPSGKTGKKPPAPGGKAGGTGTGGTGRGQVFGSGTGMELGGMGPGGGMGGFGEKFPYSWYINILYSRLWQAWELKTETGKSCTIAFSIQRDGSVADIDVDEKSGDAFYDGQAKRAVEVSSFPPLPQDFPDPELRVMVRFKFEE